MKIKLLKDIPGYKEGDVFNGSSLDSKAVFSREYASKSNPSETVFVKYPFSVLLEEGFAEEVKDEIDIEAIRRENHYQMPQYLSGPFTIACSGDQAHFFEAYLIVKAVIDKLNGDWKPDFSEEGGNLRYYIHNYRDEFECESGSYEKGTYRSSILPYMKNRETGQKVIELCGPELKVLFNVKE